MNRGFQSMLLPSQPDNEPFSVTEVTARVKALLEEDHALSDLRVAGEISNLSRPASGHLYFTLKDAGSQLKCAMWKSAAVRLRGYVPKNGDSVIARGRIGVYERDGLYQLYVEALAPQGVGDLYAEFERLKAKLQAEGLFDEARKRPLPLFPGRIGIVTSASAAAYQDILKVLRRRYPLLEVILSPSLVQGQDAPPKIVAALNRLYERGDCDVILVARGGGSIEELWAFNDERVARAIAASPVPVVSGVGHETDFTLADFAADRRAPTPSAAAEIITPDIEDLRQRVDGLSAYLDAEVASQIADYRSSLQALVRALRLLSPVNQLRQSQRDVREQRNRLRASIESRLRLNRAQLEGLSARLASVSPLATLGRGYAIVRAADGRVIRAPDDADTGARISIQVAGGEFGAVKE